MFGSYWIGLERLYTHTSVSFCNMSCRIIEMLISNIPKNNWSRGFGVVCVGFVECEVILSIAQYNREGSTSSMPRAL